VHSRLFFFNVRTVVNKRFFGSSSNASVRHILKISDLSGKELRGVLTFANAMKKDPATYSKALKDKTLLMLFEKPSLRTRVSFETGMTQMGGHGIFYSIADSPLGQKETFGDTGQVLSRYCDVVMARVKSKRDVQELSKNSTIPVINALDDWAHPCQMLADLMTMAEYKGGVENLSNIRMCYFGDCHNNVTYDLMRSACVLGFHINVCGPIDAGKDYNVEEEVFKECSQICTQNHNTNDYKKYITITNKPEQALRDNTDVIYTDSWMSYGVDPKNKEKRFQTFLPYQVDMPKLKMAKPDCIFMNCLPAMRGMEQTAEVIDGPQSVVFDQAENRLHAQKALLFFLVHGHMNIERL